MHPSVLVGLGRVVVVVVAVAVAFVLVAILTCGLEAVEYQMLPDF